ncbi:sushi domain-containing protein 2-like [Apostichopus japonicus]|uniref:sushi domain-containing protein 2-like n=1 Tax=Stichopus japonicus TaxID=307972 RepID=UPI003AB3062B
MANRLAIIIFLLVNLVFQVDGNADICAGITRGRHFVIAFTGNHDSDPTTAELSLIVVAFSDQSTTVRISSKSSSNDGPYVITFDLDARNSKRIKIPTNLLLGTTSEHSDKVIQVTATSDVSVYGLNYAPFTTDAFLAIPVNNLGLSYVAMSYESSDGRPSLFAIVGVEDETDIRIVLTAGVTIGDTSYSSGDTMQLTIHENEVIQLVSDSEYIGGSVIETDKPVALFTGHVCASTPSSFCDTLSEQLVPVESWSSTYIYTATGSVLDRSVYVIHTYYENSEVTIPGIEPVTLQVGEFWQGELQGSGVITSNQPISVLQLLRTINQNIVDPSIIQVPSEEQFSFIFGFSTPPKSGGDSEGFFNFLNIIVKSNESETILVNGEPILQNSSHSHHSIAGTPYDVYTVEVPKGEGVFFVEQSSYVDASPFSVIVYGYERDETYGYSAGLFLPNDERLLNIEPFFLREVGGEQLTITLPCLESNEVHTKNVFCRFNEDNREVEVRGYVFDVYTIICTTPRFQQLSYVTVDVTVDGKETFPFRGNVYILPQDVLPATLNVMQSDEIEGNIDFTKEKEIILEWDPAKLFAVEYIDISIQVASRELDQDEGFVWSNDIIIASSVENVGTFRFMPSEIPTESLIGLSSFGLSLSVITLKANGKSLFQVLSSGILKMTDQSGRSICSSWLQSTSVGDLPPCPCTDQQAAADESFESDKNPSLEYYHPGASSCYRSGSGGSGQQCCYGSDGNILVGPPGGGTVDAYAPGGFGGTLKHFWIDVLPFIACCKLTSQCETYYKFRPSDDCSDYQPPRPTIGTGDPHFISLDGKEFTFNGAGEFVLVKSSLHNFTFQTRMEVLADTDASVYTAFVLSSDMSDTIQVQRSSLNGTLILLNGEPIDIYFDGYLIRKQDFRGLRLTVNPDVSEITLRLHIGATALIRITSEMMSFVLQLPDGFKGQTEGLLGNFNDIADDDFILPNGSSLLPNSSLKAIHFDFGLEWILDTNTSKFTYLPPSGFSTFFNPEFLPSLVFPDVDSVSEEVRLICGDSVTCLYDAVTTNSIAFANASLRDIKTFKEAKEKLVKIVSCGHPGKIENGGINGSVFLVGYTLVASCSGGFYIEGNSEVTCHSNGSWSQQLPECVAIGCGSPGSVENGVIEGNVYDVGFSISITCNKGFTLMGQASLTCLASTSWSETLPTCVENSGSGMIVALIATVLVICGLVVIAVVGFFKKKQQVV